MPTVALPTSPGPVEAKVRFLDWGGDLVPALGGPVQRLSRLGSRHAIEFVLPPLTMTDAMAWIQRLKRGKNDRVLIPYPLMGFSPGSTGTPQIRTAASGGTTISLRGVAQGATLSEGQPLSIVVGGKRYVYSADAPATATDFAHGVANQANTTVTGPVANAFTIEKTASGGAWDGSAIGSTALSGDFVMRMRPLQTNKPVRVGVNDAPSASTSFEDIERGLYFADGGSVFSTETTSSTSLGSYNATDYWFLRRRGTTIEVLRGVTTDVAAATLQATLTSLSGTVFVDNSFFDLNGRLEVHCTSWEFASVAITPQLRTAVAVGDSVELVAPYIEGYLEGDETGWTLEAARTVGLAFTVVEAE